MGFLSGAPTRSARPWAVNSNIIPSMGISGFNQKTPFGFLSYAPTRFECHPLNGDFWVFKRKSPSGLILMVPPQGFEPWF